MMNPSCFLCGETRDLLDPHRARNISNGRHDLQHLRMQNDEYRQAIEESLANQQALSRMESVRAKMATFEGLRERISRQEQEIQRKELMLKNLESCYLASKATERREEQLAADRQMKENFLQDIGTRLAQEATRLKLLRYRKAIELFQIMRVRLSLPSPHQALRGVGSIMGLPFPHNGSLGEVPLDSLLVTLHHITHLVDSLSAALHIPLPHPLDQQSMGPVVTFLGALYSLLPTVLHSSRDSLRDFNLSTLNSLREKGDGEVMLSRSFAQALLLLKANVVTLCMRAGLPAQQLYPSPAMLCNLGLLHQFCAQEIVAEVRSPQQLQRLVQCSEREAEAVDKEAREKMYDALTKRFQRKMQIMDKDLNKPARVSENHTLLALEDDWDLIASDNL